MTLKLKRSISVSQIMVENLSKSFKVNRRKEGFLNLFKGLVKRECETIQALNGISFEMNEGEMIGYIGPNGAGKSTTVKIISGILVPDSGNCQVLGRVPWRERREYVRHIGVVFGQRSQLWWDVPVIDSFNLLKDIYRIPQKAYISTRDELVEALSLDSLLEKPVRQLSLGQKMRCELAASLLHQPPILFLDEPTIGLDAVSKLAVRDFICKLNKERGVTVILTTHDMDDIEALCSRLLIIGKGQILLDGAVARLRDTVIPERALKIYYLEKPRCLDFPGLKLVKLDEKQAEFRFNPNLIKAAELIHSVSQVDEIKDFVIENPPIEEIIAKLYGDLQI
jgi:ABC-2 type transport system ATP-binding protein